MEDSLKCSVCQQAIQISWNFCPNCGNALRTKSLSTSFFRQITIYLISFFLPPFGLAYAFKYLRKDDLRSKIVGIISIFLTILSIAAIIIAFRNFMDYYSKMLKSISPDYYSP